MPSMLYDKLVLCVDSEGEQHAHHDAQDAGKDYYDSVDDGQQFDT